MMVPIQEIINGLLTGKIKPEFGNPDHIAAVRKFEEDHTEDAPEGGKYLVSIYAEGEVEFEVMATSKEEAIEKAHDLIDFRQQSVDIDYTYSATLVKE
jgi:hypothetical protein